MKDQVPTRSIGDRIRSGWAAYRDARQEQRAAYRAAAPERKAAREAARAERKRLATRTVVRTYVGHQRSIRNHLARDAATLAQSGYVIASQSALPGHRRSAFSPRRTPKDQLTVTFQRDT